MASPSLPPDDADAARLSLYDYDLPADRIAQTPATPRDAARLLVTPRGGGELEHRAFRDLPSYLRAGDVLVLNETRVSAVRLWGARAKGGGKVEALLLRPAPEGGATAYAALVRPGRKVVPGDTLVFGEAGLRARVGERTPENGRVLRFAPLEAAEDEEREWGGVAPGWDAGEVIARLERGGRVPLPPYITAPLADRERYQTVYARTPGSAAAPTAGLHFTPELLARVEAMGVALARVRLDVGLGTFRPVRVEDVREHEMHREAYAVPPEAARAINECRGRVWAAGTTVVRALETAAQRAREAGNGNRVEPGAGETAIFIYPGHVFRGVDAIITNFHQPHSTLLLLVAAFLGRDQMRRAYAAALGDGYRFLSFGDAMLCL